MPAGSLLGAAHRIGFVIVVLVLASAGQAAERLVPGQYATIQAAINAAATGDVVIIAPGTYTGNGNRDVNFKGKAITVRGTNPDDPAVVAATVVDCQGTSASRHRGFNFITNEGPASGLSGLTIRNGFGPNEDWEGSANSAGGAIYISSASGTTSPTIRNCVIEDCQGDYWGGGIYAWKSSAVIEDCTFRNCQEAGGMGGAIYCNANGPTIRRCTFRGNSAAYGGALYCLDNTPVLADCLLTGNRATSAGGAMRLKGCTNLQITNCRIAGNRSVSEWSSGSGGGILCTDSEATIADCLIENNVAAANGDGIYSGQSHLVVRNCQIKGNSGYGGSYDGGGIACRGGSLQLENCTIDENWTGCDGGGIDCHDAHLTLLGCVVSRNSADYYAGGGLHCENSTIVIDRCLVEGNVSEDSGAGISASGGTLAISNSIIRANKPIPRYSDTSGMGRALILGNVSTTLRNCLISGHKYDVVRYDPSDSAIYQAGGELTLEGCTLADNLVDGGQVIHCSGGTATVRNCVLWADPGVAGTQMSLRYGAVATLSHCRTPEGPSAVLVSSDSTLIWGEGIIHADPGFVDADGPDNDLATWQDNNYRLSPTSPCINAGNNAIAAVFTDTTTAVGTPTSVVVADASKYSVGDEIEYDNDGVLRTVTAANVGSRTVIFDQALAAASQDGNPVRNYGQGDLDGHDRLLFGVVDMGAYERALPGDVNGDGYVDVVDLLSVVYAFGTGVGEAAYDAACDFNGDGYVDVVDLLDLVYNFGNP